MRESWTISSPLYPLRIMDSSDKWSIDNYALMLLMGAEGFTVEGLQQLEARYREKQKEEATCSKLTKIDTSTSSSVTDAEKSTETQASCVS